MQMLAGNLGQSFGLFAIFHNERLGYEKAQHRFALLGAPVEVEGDGDGADLREREKRFKMLGAAAAGEADEIALADALREQVAREPIGALLQFGVCDRPVRVDDGAFVWEMLRVARQ